MRPCINRCWSIGSGRRQLLHLPYRCCRRRHSSCSQTTRWRRPVPRRTAAARGKGPGHQVGAQGSQGGSGHVGLQLDSSRAAVSRLPRLASLRRRLMLRGPVRHPSEEQLPDEPAYLLGPANIGVFDAAMATTAQVRPSVRRVGPCARIRTLSLTTIRPPGPANGDHAAATKLQRGGALPLVC